MSVNPTRFFWAALAIAILVIAFYLFGGHADFAIGFGK